MEKILTAKELLFRILSEVKCDSEIDFLKTEDGQEYLNDIVDLINERTRLHVKEALKKASQEATTWIVPGSNGHFHEVDKESILNSYSLDNIK